MSVGDTLRLEFIEPYGLNIAETARRAGIPYWRLYGVIQGWQYLTPDDALRLGWLFNNAPEFWMGLQVGDQLSNARRVARLEDVEPLPALQPTSRSHNL